MYILSSLRILLSQYLRAKADNNQSNNNHHNYTDSIWSDGLIVVYVLCINGWMDGWKNNNNKEQHNNSMNGDSNPASYYFN